jgi:hypothetical protein
MWVLRKAVRVPIITPGMGRKSDQIARAAEPLMAPGEIVEVTAMAVIGKFNYAKSVALGIATGVATLGLVSVMTTPKPQPVVLTTKRMLILGFKGIIVEEADSKIVTEIPRSELRARPAKRVALYYAVDLTDPQGNKMARMKFGFFDRGDAQKFAQGVGEPPMVPGQK